jgi:NADH dehydrogenase/NADH:ubiquinone oxidoreductase subunit G
MTGMEVLAASLVVDGREVPVPDGGTVLDACHAAGVLVPALCHM